MRNRILVSRSGTAIRCEHGAESVYGAPLGKQTEVQFGDDFPVYSVYPDALSPQPVVMGMSTQRSHSPQKNSAVLEPFLNGCCVATSPLGLQHIKNIELLDKLRRNTKRHGEVSIGRTLERASRNIRKALTIRKTSRVTMGLQFLFCRNEISAYTLCLKLQNHPAEIIIEAVENLFGNFGDKRLDVFKAIKADNCLEITIQY